MLSSNEGPSNSNFLFDLDAFSRGKAIQMRGDKIVVQREHVKAAGRILTLLRPQITGARGKFIITIAGESGSGKSEIASALVSLLSKDGIRGIILQQDDYFVYPPLTNARMRRKDIGHVGLSEVHLHWLDENLEDIMEGKEEITKPLVIFAEDRIVEETLDLRGIGVVIVEGTYTTRLKHVHRHIFIDRTYVDTRETRRRRAREEQDDFLEEVLEIEHKIISSQRSQADILVTRDFDVRGYEEANR